MNPTTTGVEMRQQQQPLAIIYRDRKREAYHLPPLHNPIPSVVIFK